MGTQEELTTKETASGEYIWIMNVQGGRNEAERLWSSNAAVRGD